MKKKSVVKNLLPAWLVLSICDWLCSTQTDLSRKDAPLIFLSMGKPRPLFVYFLL